MAKELGVEITFDEAMRMFTGYSTLDCFRIIEAKLGRQLPKNFETEYRERSYEAFKTELKPIKGVTEFINSLTLPYCVASSGPIEKIELNLTTVGLIDKFRDKIFSSYTINSWKPEPDLFLFAAREMGFEVNSTIVIEDSKAGAIAAQKGGFRVFCVANSYHTDNLKKEGATIIHCLNEINTLL